MNYFRLALLYLYIALIYGQNPTDIRSIYMDPNTKSLSGNNGVVVIEMFNGTKSTICANSPNSKLDAMVACRNMGYNGGGSAFTDVALISSKKSTLAKTYLQNLNCTGLELSLDKCPGYKYTNSVDFKCQNNNQDLIVFCLQTYNFAKDQVRDSSCSSNVKTSNGLLTYTYNGKKIYFCGAKNQFTPKEARLFCNLLCFTNATDPRIVQGINITGLSDIPIGGFNSLSCPSNATTFDNCSNAYPFQSDECTPKDNIGVECFVSQVTPDPLPIILCQNNTLTLKWNLTVHPTIRSDTVTIEYLNIKCEKAVVTNDTLFFFLNVSLNDCNYNATGDANNIIYSYQAKRTYPLVKNVKVKEDQLFEPKCFIPRNITVVHGPFSINPSSITGGAGSTNVPVTLELFSDSTFQTKINELSTKPVGSTIFVKVMMINPPSQLVLVLSNCYVMNGDVLVQTLIDNRCPAQTTVQINSISDSISSFTFPSFSVAGATNLRVVCETSKCGKNEIGCLTNCNA